MVLLAASVFFLLAALWLLVSRRDPRLPPSPPAIPIIGHLHLRLGSVNILVASTPAAAKEVLGTRDRVFASRPLLSTAKYLDRYGLAWAPYGEHWREVRKLCTLEILTKRRIEMFKPLRRLEMTVVMDELLEAFNTMMRVVLSKSFSGACKDPSAKQKAAEFGDTVTAGIALASGANIGEFIPWLKCFDRQIPKIKELQRKMDVYLDAELQEHKQKMSSTEVLVPKDFMDVMITAGVLDDNSIKALALDMIGAGKDTSALTVEWGLSELIKNPEVLGRRRHSKTPILAGRRQGNTATPSIYASTAPPRIGRTVYNRGSLRHPIVHFMLGSLVHSFEWRSPSSTEIDMKEAFGLSLPRASPLVVSELRPRT